MEILKTIKDGLKAVGDAVIKPPPTGPDKVSKERKELAKKVKQPKEK